MRRRLIQFIAVAGGPFCAMLALCSPGAYGPWVSGLVVPVVSAGLGWRGGRARHAAVLALFVCAALVLWCSVASWELAGAITAFVGVAFLCTSKERASRTKLRALGEERELLLRQLAAQEEQEKLLQAGLRRKEEAVGEIGELYQLSKRFLATLDWETAKQITDEVLIKGISTLDEAERQRYLEQVKQLVDNGQISVEALIHCMPLAGTDFATRDRWSIVSGQLALGLQRIALYEQVQELATHDGLTGLLVRRTFNERLREEVERSNRRSTPVTFLMVDLDRFKQVNDTYGHLVGDVVLREVAALIRGSVREMDLVGRYGGEEFGVLLPDAEKDLGVQIAERIRKTIESAPIRAYDEEIHMTVSIGVALCPAHASTAEELVEKGDQAMYRAKNTGRNSTVVSE